ncbi:MAG: fatty acid desaturase [Verrucomicrobiales bacterium]
MTKETSHSQFSPWVCRAAFPLVSGCFYLTQIALVYSVHRDWIWLSIPLMLLASHFMHGLLIGFHEASHGCLRKSHFLNELDGILVGILSYTSLTLYRALHQSHHVHFATEKDAELWPFVQVDSPLWLRRLAAFTELNFGLFFTPFLFWRGFFGKDSDIRNKKLRRRIWMELILAVVFWIVAFTVVARFQLWPWYFWNYFAPAFIAGNLQSWRKYIEHVGLSGNTARSATRSIVADTWSGHFVSMMLLHEPLHGIHHLQAKLPHFALPRHIDKLEPTEDGDTVPFPNYRAAIADLLRKLPDPKAGSQWEKAARAKA